MASRCVLLLMAVCLLAACGPRPTAETIALAFIDSCKQAVQERRPSQLRDLIATAYSDSEGRTEQELLAIAAGYLLRNQSVFVFTRLQSVEEQQGRIIVSVLAALAGQPIDDVSLLPSLDADIYRFDLELKEEEGDWRLISSSWRPALVDDFLAQ